MPGAARRWRDPVRQRVPLALDGGGGDAGRHAPRDAARGRVTARRAQGALSAERERTRGSSAVVAGLGR